MQTQQEQIKQQIKDLKAHKRDTKQAIRELQHQLLLEEMTEEERKGYLEFEKGENAWYEKNSNLKKHYQDRSVAGEQEAYKIS